MTSVSNKESQKIFLTTNTNINEFGKNINIILSPEFYWVRNFEIPVKTEAQARHVLPTLFEDILEDISILTYQVFKLEENKFLCFAYDNKKIYEVIKKTNIPISNINAIYFAQNECKEFKTFGSDNLKFMYTSDGILVKVPNGLLEEVVDLNKIIDNINLNSNKLQIKLYNNVIESKYYYSLIIIFAILIFLNVTKYIDYSNEIINLENSILENKKNYNLPSSMIQTKSILDKYEKTIKEENKKREVISYLLGNTKFNLNNVYVENDIINLEYLSVNKSDVENFISKKYKILSSIQNSFSLKVRIKL